jgi:DNA-binding CsgD family transcriptional regulator
MVLKSTPAKPATPEGPSGVPLSVENWQTNLRTASPRPISPLLPLSAREQLVATLFADDHTADEIALVLGLSAETVRSYLVRARLKYRNVGRPATDKLQLRVRLIEDGDLEE